MYPEEKQKSSLQIIVMQKKSGGCFCCETQNQTQVFAFEGIFTQYKTNFILKDMATLFAFLVHMYTGYCDVEVDIKLQQCWLNGWPDHILLMLCKGIGIKDNC